MRASPLWRTTKPNVLALHDFVPFISESLPPILGLECEPGFVLGESLEHQRALESLTPHVLGVLA
jgi:hypothetical protein